MESSERAAKPALTKGCDAQLITRRGC